MLLQRILSALDKGLVDDLGAILFEHVLGDNELFQEMIEQCWDNLTDEDAELQLLDEGFHFRGFKKNDHTKRIWLDQVMNAFQGQGGQRVPIAPVRPTRPKQFASRELTGGAPPPRARRIRPKKIRERDE